jgi:thiopurine S-methyltransferase
LRQHWPELNLTNGGKVFVPLCGKSLDLLWLGEHGYSVIGVEISSIAVNSFFTENDIQPTHISHNNFENYEAQNIKIMCGDFFDLEKVDLANIDTVYDRASLVALPPEMRERYVRHLVNILPPKTQILLITFDYPQDEMSGPPFAVSVNEVKSFFAKYAEVRLLAQHDAMALNPRFKERGLSRIHENVFLISLN